MSLVLLLVVCAGFSSSTAAAVSGRCQPQGLLKLDKPYPQPRRVELPFCQQYGCSCCNASHALALQRSSRVIAEDEDLSTGCKLGLLRLACRLCDPEVGVGIKKHICSDTCKDLYDACSQDFFSYDSSNGLVSPCSDETSGMLVCSQLSDLVSTAAEFCKAAGFGRMATDGGLGQPCFDGSPVSADACPAEPPPSQQKEQKKQAQKRQQRRTSSKQQDPISRLIARLPWKLKRRHKRYLAVAAELLIGTAVSGLMGWAVVLLLQRVMQPARRRGRLGGAPPANVREMLAKAAEKRSRAVFKEQ